MSKRVIKRSGKEVAFDKQKIVNALNKSNNNVELSSNKLSDEQILDIANHIELEVKNKSYSPNVEEIQDLVEKAIMNLNKYEVAKEYIIFRFKKSLAVQKNKTDDNILSLINNDNEELKQENSNKNPTIISVQRDYMAGEVSKDITERLLLPEDVIKAHKEGIIHFHDMDYFAQRMFNCCLINLEDMLQNGTIISGTYIDKPHSFRTAATITSQIVAQVASGQYGGQTFSIKHLAPFVDVSRQKIKSRLKKEFKDLNINIDEEKLNELTELELTKEIEDGCQTIQYQLITLQTTNGQAPFVTVFMYLNEAESEQEKKDLAKIIEVMLQQRIKGVKNNKGVYITPAFPKLIYVLQEDNIEEGSEYFALTELAAKCTAKRLVPDYISEKVMKKLKQGQVYSPMGCRSFITVDRWSDVVGNIAKSKNFKPGRKQQESRFNQGVVTLNLVDVALSSGKDMAKFWDLMDERTELCHKALRCRHERLLGTKSDVSPIHWQGGAIARLAPGETIDKLLYNGYSTISLGYAGLAEAVKYMLGVSHTSEEGKYFGLKVMQFLNSKCNQWKDSENIDYSVYGTPLESTTYKFAKSNQRKFGIIEGVTDKNYITNSYHIHVTENIDAFSKLTKEADFQELSPGGAISYVEVPNMQNNIPAVLAVMKHIYNNIMYAEINTKSDTCLKCNYDGEIKIKDDNGKLYWECPNCGNRDENLMSVARRTCGYIGSNFWNQGRTQEIKERVLHL